MQAAVSFHNIRHPAERAEAQTNAFGTHPGVREKRPQPWTFRGSQPGGRALTRRFEVLPLHSWECCTSFQTVFGVLSGST